MNNINIKEYMPLIAFITLICALDLFLFLNGEGTFVSSNYIRQFEINQLLMPLPLIKNLLLII